MFTAGHIIYFPTFYFKNGNTAKPKYFIVLRIIDGKTIVASLPTRVNNAPTLINVLHGCINQDDRVFNCYTFEPGRVICDNGFFFDLPTFIYGNQVEDYDVEIFEEVYRIEGIDYEIKGTLNDDEFERITNCIKNSASTKRKIKRLLS
ncbi:hypothetical protein [Terrimonas ferruginea]|uniref:hypothetical protein n=1 Tax=Terrimonas ferruginea TaxID=249 RepID=UPI00048E1251|nr:hypothetical protein [Terrimonas ferruginea]